MFRSFFKKNTKNSKEKTFELDEKTFSLACILVEAALADESFGEDEKKIIIKILKKQSSIDDNEYLDKTLERAIKTFNEASDLITHTRKIKNSWSLEERIEVIEMLWEVCLVDGMLEPYEDMLIRRVSGLIYVDDKSRAIAKSNALKKLNDK